MIVEDAMSTCYDAALCLCETWNPAASESELEACAEAEITPRGAITLADFCGEHADHTLGEALRGYAEVYGAVAVTDEGCEQLPATLFYDL